MADQTIQLNLPFDAGYAISEAMNPEALAILLHGYTQQGAVTLKKVKDAFPNSMTLLAPNGPFPVASKNPLGGARIGYTWYFYNPFSDEYWIDQTFAVQYLAELVKELGFESLPKVVVGYSQGGYLAPVAALALSDVRQVIGISCRPLHEELKLPLPFRLDTIHGELDDTVDAKASQESYEILRKGGMIGDYHLIPGTGHGIDDAVVASLRDTLAQVFPIRSK